MYTLDEIWKTYAEPIAVEIAIETVSANNMRKDDINDIVQEKDEEIMALKRSCHSDNDGDEEDKD